MKKINAYLSSFVLFLFTLESIYGQPSVVDTSWTRLYHDVGWEAFYDVKQTSDSGFICLGRTNDFGESEELLWIVKTDDTGNIEWENEFGALYNATTYGKSLIANDDHYYCIGNFTKSDDVYATPSVLLLKYDKKGSYLWHKVFKPENIDILGSVNYGRKILLTADKHLMILSESFQISNTSGQSEIWLMKADLDGNIIWSEFYDLGFNYSETPNSIIETTDGGFAIVGDIQTPFTSPWTDLFILKVDKNGEKLWQKIYGGAGYDTGNDIKQLKNGGFIIGGLLGLNFENYDQNGQAWLLRTDELGDTISTRNYGGIKSERAKSIAITADNGFLLVGNTEIYVGGFWDVWIVRTDSLGDTLWTKTLGNAGADEGYSVERTFDGGYIICGYYTSINGNSRDGYLIKLSPEQITSVEDKERDISPTNYILMQNYPNPFNPVTNITYSIPVESLVTIKVYDLLGREVAELVNNVKETGKHSVTFDGSGLASGMYIVNMQAADFTRCIKILLMK